MQADESKTATIGDETLTSKDGAFFRAAMQWLPAAGLAFSAIVLGSALLQQTSSKDPTGVGAAGASLSDATVIAELNAGSRAYPPELREAAAKARANPLDRAAALMAARGYLDYGRSIGEARFVGAALGVLTPFTEDGRDVQALNLAASATQYMHDFDGAVRLLDLALKTSPNDAQALLSLANIKIVQGKLAEATQDCERLIEADRGDLAVLCIVTSRALSSDADAQYLQLAELLERNALDPSLNGYAQSLLGEMARFLDKPDDARVHFAAALKLDPQDARTRLVSSDLELAAGRPREALAILTDQPPTDSVMVRQAIAYKMLQEPGMVETLAAPLRQRFSLQAAIGETAHAREEARFWLKIEGNAGRALKAATENFKVQRELEDAILLLDAARSAKRPEAAVVVRDWAKAEGVVAPMYLKAEATQ